MYNKIYLVRATRTSRMALLSSCCRFPYNWKPNNILFPFALKHLNFFKNMANLAILSFSLYVILYVDYFKITVTRITYFEYSQNVASYWQHLLGVSGRASMSVFFFQLGVSPSNGNARSSSKWSKYSKVIFN